MRLAFEEDDEKSPMLREDFSAEFSNEGKSGGVARVSKSQQKGNKAAVRKAQRGMRLMRIGSSPPIGPINEQRRGEGFEMCDFEAIGTNSKNARRFGRLVKRRLLLLLLCSAFVVFILLAILAFFVLIRSTQLFNGQFGEGTQSKAVGNSQSEHFMHLYERIMRFRTNPAFIADSMLSNIPADELAQAKSAGILPIRERTDGFSSEPDQPSAEGNGTKRMETMANSNGFYHHKWHHSNCDTKCEKDDISIPPLVVISLDGFWHGYLNLNIVRTLDRMGECGARADFLFPSFPTRTFPNHYTIATGLWPGMHGVVDNEVYDPQISAQLEQMSDTKNAAFYGGEPIWSWAVRQHKRVFCLFWPGCSFNITGYNPTVDLPYNSSFPYSQRVDKIVEWLTLPAVDRPSLVMAYFDQPDNVGHYHTVEQQVQLELVYLESVLDYLFNSLRRHALLDCINLIILSDHGMQWLNNRFYYNEMIGSSISPGVIGTSGAIGHIYFSNGTNSSEFGERLVNKFACYDNTKFHLYDRKRMPKRYHYERLKRVGDLIFDGRPGVAFDVSTSDFNNLTSDHGYDYRFDRMHAVFFARGPNIRKGIRIEPFQNVELFNLFIDLLRLPQNVPNNGTLGVLDRLIQNMDLHRPPFFPFDPDLHPLGECAVQSKKRQLALCKGTSEEATECEQKNIVVQQKMDACDKRQVHPLNAFFYTKLPNLCAVSLCPALLLTSFGEGKAAGIGPTILYESLSASDFPSQLAGANGSRQCPFFDKSIDQKCQSRLANESNGTVWESIAASKNNVYSDFVPLRFPMFSPFANGPFTYLQNLTEHYVKLFGRVVSITGTIMDEDMDGIGDQQRPGPSSSDLVFDQPTMPTHFFRMLLRCEGDLWHLDGINCKSSNGTRLIAFVLPNVQRELNCLSPDEYLLVNTARVRDLELLTGVQFFAERMWYPTDVQLRWRTDIVTKLW